MAARVRVPYVHPTKHSARPHTTPEDPMATTTDVTVTLAADFRPFLDTVAAHQAEVNLNTAACEACGWECEPAELAPGPSGDMYCDDCLTTYAESAH